MPTVRIISYNLDGCRDMAALSRTIEMAGADFVALQNIAAIPGGYSLATLAANSGYQFHSQGSTGTLALLAHQQVNFIQTYALGDGACCMKADLHLQDKRFILLNISLRGGFFSRPAQIRSLLGPNLLAPEMLSLPTILLGDFYDIVWVSGHYRFNDQLRRFAPKLLRATYPANCPIISRDRVYAMGGIKLVDIRIDHGKLARLATRHLPIIFTIEVTDSRITLPARELSGNQQMEVAPS